MKLQKESKLALAIGGASCLLLCAFAAVVLSGSNLDDTNDRAEILHNLLVSVAVVVGGGWVLFQFAIKRAYETALEINFATACAPHGKPNFLVFIDCILRNPASRKLGAKSKKYKDGKSLAVFEDEAPVGRERVEQPERLHHSVSLQIKRLKAEIPANTLIDWYETPEDASVKNLFDESNEINLIESYEIPGIEEVHFWMEPGETYHLGTPIVMAEGRYVAMITFVGSDGDQEFWRRLFVFSVPPSEVKGAGDEPSPSPKTPAASLTPEGKRAE